MLLLIHIAFTLLFVVLGLVFRSGRGSSLIAGYNTMPQEEKDTWDEQALCRAMGRLMFLLALCWLVIASSEVFHKMWLYWVGIGLFLAVVIGAVVYFNTGNRFRK